MASAETPITVTLRRFLMTVPSCLLYAAVARGPADCAALPCNRYAERGSVPGLAFGFDARFVVTWIGETTEDDYIFDDVSLLHFFGESVHPVSVDAQKQLSLFGHKQQ